MDLKKSYLSLFVIGLVNAIYQLAIIKQLYIAKPFDFITIIINLTLALTIVSLGIGAYLSKYIKQSKLRQTILFLSLSIIFVFVFILLFSPEEISKLSLITTFVLISIPMILMGISIALIYLSFIQKKEIKTLVFSHVLGFGLGQIIGIFFIKTIGVNILFLLMPGLLILLIVENKTRKVFLFIIFLLLISSFQIEPKLEALRNKEKTLWSNVQNEKHVYSGWSPYSKIDVYHYDNDCLAGVYNYSQQWMTCKDKTKDCEFRKLLYPQIKGDVLLIGTGGGIGINAFEENTNVTAIEIDPLVVHLMKTKFKEYNNNAYNNVKTYAVDGRAFLESSKKQYDYIIFEGVDYTRTSKFKTFIRIENYLHTKQGLITALSSLKENGVLLLLFTDSNLIASKTIASIPENYSYKITKGHVYSPVTINGIILTITKDKSKIDRLSSFFEKYPRYFEEYDDLLLETEGITDNRPFLYLPDKLDLSAFCYLLAFLSLAIILTSLIKKKIFHSYFFLLGSGMMIAELFYINIFRSLFSDYVTTFVVISIIFFSGFSIGTYFNKYLKKYLLLTVLLMFSSLLLVLLIPWSLNLGVKILFSTITIFPTALFMGTFFPLGLDNIEKQEFPLAYLLDSTGSAVGFFLFYILAIWFGFTFSFYLVLIIYFILLIILQRRS